MTIEEKVRAILDCAHPEHMRFQSLPTAGAERCALCGSIRLSRHESSVWARPHLVEALSQAMTSSGPLPLRPKPEPTPIPPGPREGTG